MSSDHRSIQPERKIKCPEVVHVSTITESVERFHKSIVVQVITYIGSNCLFKQV